MLGLASAQLGGRPDRLNSWQGYREALEHEHEHEHDQRHALTLTASW
jgi:hypothetical protein